MPPKRKSPSKKLPARQPPEDSRALSGRRAKTKALAIGDAVRRQALRGAGLANPLAILEPLRQSMVERQIALVGAAMTWSPAHILVSQQAAFWDGFTDAAAKRSLRQKPASKRTRAR